MTRPLLLTLAAACAACGPDSSRFAISLELDTQGCPGGGCELIEMSCDAEMMVRIVPVGDPLAQPYVVVCDRITGGGDLCELATIDLSDVPAVPNEMVEIQVGVWRYDEDDPDDDDEDDSVDCGPLEFDASGGVRRLAPAPAIGGHAFFEVGSSDVATVVLECLNAPELHDQSCRLPDTAHVAVGVFDFDLPVSVTGKVADNLDVRVGAPEETPGGWRLDDPDTTALIDTSTSPPPTWTEPVGSAIAFDDVACVQVERTDLAKRATTVTCVPYVPPAPPANEDDPPIPFEITSWYVDTVTLGQIRQALDLDTLPTEGIVVGRVLDADGIAPEAGVIITPTPGATVLYPNDDMMSFNTIETGESGLFVSIDAAFHTTWSGRDGVKFTQAPGFGGRLRSKVTIVVLQMEP